jgi:hypothetical protein
MYGGMGGGGGGTSGGAGAVAAATTTAAIVLPNTGALWMIDALAAVSIAVGTAIVASTVWRSMAHKAYK